MEYKEIGQMLPMDRYNVHVESTVATTYGLDREIKGRNNAINAFNKIAQQYELKPLHDPTGYMKLRSNAYDYLKQSYKSKYQDMQMQIESGMMAGGSYGVKSILSKLDSVVRKDAKEYLPKGIKYTDLRFTPVDENLKMQIDDFTDKRSKLTFAFMNKRSFEPETLMRMRNDFTQSGKRFGALVEKSWEYKDKTNVLSVSRLLENSKNNQEGFDSFKKQLTNPDEITKDDEHGIYATYTTKTKPEAKFLLDNRKYLADFGFDIKKGRGVVSMSWNSPKIEKLYEENQKLNLDDSLNDLSKQSESNIKL